MKARDPLILMTAGFVMMAVFACQVKEPAKPVPAVPLSDSALNRKYNVDQIKLPPHFKMGVFAEAPGARSLCESPSGTLFVGTMNGDVYALRDTDKNGVADENYIIASGLNSPNGVAFKDGNLYVAEISRILRFNKIEEHLKSPPGYQVVYDQLPSDRHHGWKFIAFGPDGKLYVPVGAPCNICEEENPVYASIARMNPDGTAFEIFAKGIRNTVGFDWDPQTGALWFTDNGRDNLGDDIPSDELNTAPKAGLHFGFPYCHEGDILDPKFGKGKNCADFAAPVLKLGAHVAALGMRFYSGSAFPPEYKNQIFIAQHGSWNRTTPVGYRVMIVRLENNKPVSYEPFATGWLDEKGNVLGRPVDVQVHQDGSLLVSDDRNGVVYRIARW
ncbi:MAG: PQQ-dependent sugar dehydrogenase [Flavisolibacter sp.]